MRKLLESIKKHEGFRHRAYQDTEGVWTIGYGTNLQVLEIAEPLAHSWLLADAARCLLQVDAYLTANRITLTDPRRFVLAEMTYNLGWAGTLAFRKMWRAIERGDYETAAAEMLDSKWHTQVGQRAKTMAEQMRSGIFAAQ